MATVVVGCDINNSNDSKVQNTVINALEKQGHTVEKLPIKPGPFAEYSYSKKAKGKIGVYIIADGIFSIADLTFGNTYFKYAYFIIRGDLGRLKNRKQFETKTIGADSDCTSICNKIKGKTFPEMNKICKNKCQIVFGTNATEMANELVKAMGGETSSSSSNKSSSSLIKTALQEALYGWNGEVYCYLKDDTIYIGRVPEPTDTKLSLIEGDNIYQDSISVTDVNPDTINKLIVHSGSKQFIIKDDYLIKRFGEKKKTITSTIKSEKNIIGHAYREFNKLLKDSGRVLECKVNGDAKWRIGKWVRVYIPSFHLNGYMWITKVSHDDNDGGNWEASLTLKDYPPDLGVEPSQKASENSNSSGES